MANAPATEPLRLDPPPTPVEPPRSVEVLFRGSAVLLVGLTLLLVAWPGAHGHAIAPAIDLFLDTTAAVVSVCVTILMWVRHRERADQVALFQAAGFLALAVAYALAVLVSIQRDGDLAELAHPNDGQVYVFAVARLLTASLVVLGGTIGMRGLRGAPPALVMLLPFAILLPVAALANGGDLVRAVPALAIVVPDAPPDALPVVTPLGAGLGILGAVLFLSASLVLRSEARRGGAVGDAYIAIGLLFAAFAELHWAMYPVGHPGQVSTADLLRLALFFALLIAIEAEARWTLGHLRTANAELTGLRERDLERAALEERSRLARELHDGLAQSLWLAKLKAAQLGASPELPSTLTALAAETTAAVDTGLAEARQAVMALRMAADTGDGFADLMARYINDFEDRFGLRVEFSCHGDTRRIPPRSQAELLRIAQEALVNVRRHARATAASVRLDVSGEVVALRIADNGVGFDPAAVADTSYGLHAMRERTLLLRGEIAIDSSPGNGTRIGLTAPLLGPGAVPS